jgi:hypothetical protein
MSRGARAHGEEKKETCHERRILKIKDIALRSRIVKRQSAPRNVPKKNPAGPRPGFSSQRLGKILHILHICFTGVITWMRQWRSEKPALTLVTGEE